MREKQPKLAIVPITFAEAKEYINKHHRHHKPSISAKFSVAVADEANEIRGVAMVGRPIARMLDDGWTLEITRVATDGCPNACSMESSACLGVSTGCHVHIARGGRYFAQGLWIRFGWPGWRRQLEP